MLCNTLPCPPVTVLRGDLGDKEFAELTSQDVLGWDIETSGLEWSKGQIHTCQLACADGRAFVVQIGSGHPAKLLSLLANQRVRKVFHHAPFDLRFLLAHWAAVASNVFCTKIASKLFDREETDHSLKALLLRHLGVTIDKSARLSDWSAHNLTEAQLRYAANDVRFLIPLMDRLQEGLQRIGRWDLAVACFRHLPTRATLEVGGFGDVFAY
jgi:ribonuclease D